MIPGILSGPLCNIDRDPNFSNVCLLLHMESLADSSINNLSGTLAGAAALSTAQSKFGNKSLALTAATADGLKYSSSSIFNIQATDYTLEGWFWPNDVSGGAQQAMFMFNGAANQNPYTMIIGPTLYWRATNAGSDLEPSATHGMTLNAWNFVAQCKSGNTFSTWINGTRIATATTSGLITSENKAFTIGGGGVIATFNGYVDEVRLTSVARYSGTTCPVPTAPFPNY